MPSATRDAVNAMIRRADASQAELGQLAAAGNGFPAIAVPRLVWTGLDVIGTIAVTQESPE
jgi:hypothetical protein